MLRIVILTVNIINILEMTYFITLVLIDIIEPNLFLQYVI